MTDARFWDERYAAPGRVWSGRPNPWLVVEACDLAPGAALDIGAGEGADAIWLAERGWYVTAVDFSAVALARVAEMAAAAGATQRVATLQADATAWTPPQRSFDLVAVHFLHLPAPPRAAALRAAWSAVAPGGSLLVVGHDRSNADEGHGGPPDPTVLFTADEVLADLAEAVADGAEVVVAERRSREVAGADGAVALDAVVVLRRPS